MRKGGSSERKERPLGPPRQVCFIARRPLSRAELAARHTAPSPQPSYPPLDEAAARALPALEKRQAKILQLLRDRASSNAIRLYLKHRDKSGVDYAELLRIYVANSDLQYLDDLPDTPSTGQIETAAFSDNERLDSDTDRLFRALITTEQKIRRYLVRSRQRALFDAPPPTTERSLYEEAQRFGIDPEQVNRFNVRGEEAARESKKHLEKLFAERSAAARTERQLQAARDREETVFRTKRIQERLKVDKDRWETLVSQMRRIYLQGGAYSAHGEEALKAANKNDTLATIPERLHGPVLDRVYAIALQNPMHTLSTSIQDVADFLRAVSGSAFHDPSAGSAPARIKDEIYRTLRFTAGLRPVGQEALALKADEVEVGMRVYTLIGQDLAEVEVVQIRTDPRTRRRTFLVRNVRTQQLLPKTRSASALRRRKEKHFG